jgi:hypothetical protein
VVVTGTLSGSGTLTIPAGATLVSLTGRGGNGTNDYWYDPGQAYIAPSGYHAGYYTTPATYKWGGGVSDGAAYNQPYPGASSGNFPTVGAACAEGAHVDCWVSGGGTNAGTSDWAIFYSHYDAVLNTPASGWVAPYYDNPGQPYIAPSSGGGPQYGTSTTATLNGTTRTWTGGYDSGVQGTTSTQTLTSTGAGQSLTYSVPGTGTLSYSYEY